MRKVSNDLDISTPIHHEIGKFTVHIRRQKTPLRMPEPESGEEALAFRRPMPVTEIQQFRSGDTYPVCPQCRSTLDREYQAYCDRCGQRLGWESFLRAKVIRKF